MDTHTHRSEPNIKPYVACFCLCLGLAPYVSGPCDVQCLSKEGSVVVTSAKVPCLPLAEVRGRLSKVIILCSQWPGQAQNRRGCSQSLDKRHCEGLSVS